MPLPDDVLDFLRADDCDPVAPGDNVCIIRVPHIIIPAEDNHIILATHFITTNSTITLSEVKRKVIDKLL